MAPFPVKIFCNIKALKLPNNILRNIPSYLFTSSFTLSLNASIDTPAFSRDSMSLIISSMTVCYYHVTYSFQSESALCNCLDVEKLLA